MAKSVADDFIIQLNLSEEKLPSLKLLGGKTCASSASNLFIGKLTYEIIEERNITSHIDVKVASKLSPLSAS